MHSRAKALGSIFRCPQESLELDPRGRHATVCLAHLSCFASASASTSANPGRNHPFPLPTTDLRWTPPDERTRELLRVLELGVSTVYGGVSDEESWRNGGGVGRVMAGGGGSDAKWGAFNEEQGGGVEAWVLLACVARATGDAAGAVSMFRKALALDPDCLEGKQHFACSRLRSNWRGTVPVYPRGKDMRVTCKIGHRVLYDAVVESRVLFTRACRGKCGCGG